MVRGGCYRSRWLRDFTDDKDAVIAELEFAIVAVRTATEEMRTGKRSLDHYGG